MMKTLAALAVILAAMGMAVGLKMAGDRDKTVSAVSPEVIKANNQAADKIKLDIVSPMEKVVSKPSLVVSGVTVPMAEVQVDDKEVKADDKGNFSAKLILDEGENEIVVTANDENGEYTEKSVKVTYEPAE